MWLFLLYYFPKGDKGSFDSSLIPPWHPPIPLKRLLKRRRAFLTPYDKLRIEAQILNDNCRVGACSNRLISRITDSRGRLSLQCILKIHLPDKLQFSNIQRDRKNGLECAKRTSSLLEVVSKTLYKGTARIALTINTKGGFKILISLHSSLKYSVILPYYLCFCLDWNKINYFKTP